MRIFIFALLFWAPWSVAQQSVTTIFLVRHAEKASNADDSPLSPAGLKRADCLAGMLKDAAIKEIFVTDARRTQQTAEPLAKQLNIAPKILPANDEANLVRNVLYAAGNSLVVGHSNTLPIVVARLHAGQIAPIGENDYDKLYEITAVDGAATPTVTLHYCPAAASPAPAGKAPAPTKAPSKKSPVKK